MRKLDDAVFHMVITDMSMETETAGYDVIRAAQQKPYSPATSILTAYPSLGSDWKNKGAQSLLVKPMNTQDLLRQIEALLIAHEDQKSVLAAATGKAALSARTTRNQVKKAG